MYNYLKNGVTINADVMSLVNLFNETARTLATESVEHTTTKKSLNETLEAYVKDEKAEEVKSIQAQIDALEDAWTIRRKALEFILFGGKNDKGEKVAGVCDIVSNDLYKSYVDMIENNTTAEYREQMRIFCGSIVNGGADALKEGAYNHLYNDIVQTMSSVRFNSNSQIAQGAAFITAINKRTYKKMLLGAIHDIVSNNRTLKVKKAKKAEAENK